jgi:hypothetical protein
MEVAGILLCLSGLALAIVLAIRDERRHQAELAQNLARLAVRRQRRYSSGY